MQVSHHILCAPSGCSYLPHETWQLEYVRVSELSRAEYSAFLLRGWRRFGRDIFHPKCPQCAACQSLRVVVDQFLPDRSQRRNRALNQTDVQLTIGGPWLDAHKVDLFRRYHDFQTDHLGWRDRIDSEDSLSESFVDNPFPTEEWRYSLDGKLVGIGYVDALPIGLSAIYFVHDPAHRHRGLGTWNVLSLIQETRARGLPHLYLGYHVAGCRSLAYKTRFHPHEILDADGAWHPPRSP